MHYTALKVHCNANISIFFFICIKAHFKTVNSSGSNESDSYLMVEVVNVGCLTDRLLKSRFCFNFIAPLSNSKCDPGPQNQS